MDKRPTEESNDSYTVKDGGEHPESVHKNTELEPPPDEILALLSSILSTAEEASDSASLAVWTSGMSGPLPPPWILKEYDQTITDGANRIMAMAEKAQAAMIADGENQRKAERRAQIFAFICVLSILGTGIVLMVIGQVVAGLLLSCPGLAAVVYAFLRSRG